ncbi:hypothetical protein CYMTET_10058 [Cymbomonas tetramitiformis]|uniref:Uncharacterized protein n=1 Tax=Cymbomonas tetramitiformis TaxID=36881 RepID=A0AAE0GQE4_9CHLO|nr:hypothetical protein CYMTET_10058 [Cymbomonas tetramitiformis]
MIQLSQRSNGSSKLAKSDISLDGIGQAILLFGANALVGENGTQSGDETLNNAQQHTQKPLPENPDKMLNAQLLKAIRPRTKSRTSESRKRAAEESKPPTKRTRLPEIVSMPVLDAQDSPMGETTEPSQEEFSTPTELNTPGEATATPTSLGEVDLSGPPSPYEEPGPRKQFRWGKAEVKTFKPDKQQNSQKKKSGATSPTGLRAEDPTGTNKGRVPTRIVANALLQPYAYTKHAASPKGDKIPSVAKAIDEVSKLPTKVALGTNREEEIENIVTSWWEDTRDLPLPENRPEEFWAAAIGG